MPDFSKVVELDSLVEGSGTVVKVEGKELALFRIGDDVYALDNFCPHRGGPLGEGIVSGEQVTCPWHDWSFEIKSGECTFNPAARARTYQTRIQDGVVEVAL